MLQFSPSSTVHTLLPFALALLMPMCAWAQTTPAPETTKPAVATPAEPVVNPKVLIKTSMGDITVELNAEKAPKSVENFLQYARDGFYNGTIFHRVIDTHDPGGGFTPACAKTDPALHPQRSQDGLSNTRGTLAMARTPDPNSATPSSSSISWTTAISTSSATNARRLGVMPYLATSSQAWKWSIRSRQRRPVPKAPSAAMFPSPTS